MQDTVDQAHGAVPRARAGIIAVLSVCRRRDPAPGRHEHDGDDDKADQDPWPAPFR
jgi:hypothetical protein